MLQDNQNNWQTNTTGSQPKREGGACSPLPEVGASICIRQETTDRLPDQRVGFMKEDMSIHPGCDRVHLLESTVLVLNPLQVYGIIVMALFVLKTKVFP